jgi:hypothetical protein
MAAKISSILSDRYPYVVDPHTRPALRGYPRRCGGGSAAADQLDHPELDAPQTVVITLRTPGHFEPCSAICI